MPPPPELPRNSWVANCHFTSCCNFCNAKNTVLQHCETSGCHFNICQPCMASGVLAQDKKHEVGSNEVGHFEWQPKITTPRPEYGAATTFRAAPQQHQQQHQKPWPQQQTGNFKTLFPPPPPPPPAGAVMPQAGGAGGRASSVHFQVPQMNRLVPAEAAFAPQPRPYYPGGSMQQAFQRPAEAAYGPQPRPFYPGSSSMQQGSYHQPFPARAPPSLPPTTAYNFPPGQGSYMGGAAAGGGGGAGRQPYQIMPGFRPFVNSSGTPQDIWGAPPPPPAGPAQGADRGHLPNERYAPVPVRATSTSAPELVQNGLKRPAAQEANEKTPGQESNPPTKRLRGVVTEEEAPTVKNVEGALAAAKKLVVDKSRPETPPADQSWDEYKQVIASTNTLTAMSRGGYATAPPATSPHPHMMGGGGDGGATRPGPDSAPMTPVGNEQFVFPPTPGSVVQSSPKSSDKGKQVEIAIGSNRPTTPDQDVPWNPLHDRVPITKAQWNERAAGGGPEGGLSGRARVLRHQWARTMALLRLQFGFEEDEDECDTEEDEFRRCWERMMACMPDMRVENRRNRTIAMAVAANVEMVLKRTMAAWEEGPEEGS